MVIHITSCFFMSQHNGHVVSVDGTCAEWSIIELQGDLQLGSQISSPGGKFVGDLHFTKEGVPVCIIGHHILYGKCLQLEKPIVVLTKSTHAHDEVHDMDVTDGNQKDPTDPHYTVKAVVKKKILFKTRPKPIIANVPTRL